MIVFSKLVFYHGAFFTFQGARRYKIFISGFEYSSGNSFNQTLYLSYFL